MKNTSIITTGTYNNVVEKGAFGCILITPDKELPLAETFVKSTAPRLELLALIKALEEIERLYPRRKPSC